MSVTVGVLAKQLLALMCCGEAKIAQLLMDSRYLATNQGLLFFQAFSVPR